MSEICYDGCNVPDESPHSYCTRATYMQGIPPLHFNYKLQKMTTILLSRGGFSFSSDSFYSEVGNDNRHRHATVASLNAHFLGEGLYSHPAHWYEAQRLHYGFPPSKRKGTSHKRFFDDVMKEDLAVPEHIQKIEADL